MRLTKQFAAAALLCAYGFAVSAEAQSDATCNASSLAFELSDLCITERGLDEKVRAYRQEIDKAMELFGASYKVDLRIIKSKVYGPYPTPPAGDVWTDVVRNKDMRHGSFIISVTAEFLENQPDILYEASARHEICHIINDDLAGYHRQGGNVEVAEEKCVMQAVGEARYREYLQAYATYKGWNSSQYDDFLQRVKDVVLVPPPVRSDDADKAALAYFQSRNDGLERLLIYNGTLHDVTLSSTRNSVRHDPEKLDAVIQEGKPMVFFHNHPDDGRAAMFPSYNDFGVAGLFLFKVYRENPDIEVEFRVVKLGAESTIVSYGFKGTALKEVKTLAQEYRMAAAYDEDVAPIVMRQNIQNYHLMNESYNNYLQYACPVDLTRKDPEICRTHPDNFIWPSDRFFLQSRPQ